MRNAECGMRKRAQLTPSEEGGRARQMPQVHPFEVGNPCQPRPAPKNLNCSLAIDQREEQHLPARRAIDLVCCASRAGCEGIRIRSFAWWRLIRIKRVAATATAMRAPEVNCLAVETPFARRVVHAAPPFSGVADSRVSCTWLRPTGCTLKGFP